MARKPKRTNSQEIEINHFCYPIAYIDASKMEFVEEELGKYVEYKDVTAMIPTIKILKKTFKGKQTFENVPLLFNYGFFKMPRQMAIRHKFLESLKNDISCIYAWVKDPQKVMGLPPTIRPDGKSIYEDKHVPIATATGDQVANLIKESFTFSAHDYTDLGTAYPGMMITLQGYPFDDMPAEIVEIDEAKRKVKVKLHIFQQIKEVTVAFDNVFFTIYHSRGYDDTISVKKSLDEMMDNNSFDKAQFKNRPKDE